MSEITDTFDELALDTLNAYLPTMWEEFWYDTRCSVAFCKWLREGTPETWQQYEAACANEGQGGLDI